ncbi:hypothetical protein AGABI1DRAFT_128907 [Agaricus bisporus var. burnettii JB137-S8]|uniref:F-box domain-containing protein n=1 Tax=Agaricus bisporus var. burnettii (strain JB137-S8 / ATCC MYA-4627 / FGSC 10392) TaxID=597362 RepID=K5XU87_AGABU|nr:uncharacterized protein AGABI1DRAFT_128907 [Agaricus bisporus var. burnettii JB137-S8]EKM78620.1 hypothetical protein AGABI1DRAFT_128907 [Agaricus bisporus var. burnettii JB137-S8]
MLIKFSDLPDDIIYVLGKSLKEEGIADVYTLMLLVLTRIRCQNLAYITTTISHTDPLSWDEKTSFLQLRNLRGLSVVIKTSQDNPHDAISEPPLFLSRFPSSFWEMIHPSRSPKLRSLTFESDKLRSFDFNPLFKLKLPSLRVLAIGAFVFSDFSCTDLVSFLAFTRKMEHLEISPVARIPWQDIHFDQLQHYGGNAYSVMAGAAHWSSLRALDISSLPLSFVRMTNFVQKSSRLPLLKFLKLRVTSEDTICLPSCPRICGDSDPSLDLVPALACCYPGLEELHMISSVGSILPWDSILVSLRRFRNLRRFHLSQVPPRLGGSTLQTAVAALFSNNKIEQVVVSRSVGPWQRVCDYKIDEKVIVGYLNRQSQIVTVHRINYRDSEYVSSSKFLLSWTV